MPFHIDQGAIKKFKTLQLFISFVMFIFSHHTADVKNMPMNTGSLSVILNGGGGIVDDLIVSKTDQGYIYMVSNAGCAMKVKSHVEVKQS